MTLNSPRIKCFEIHTEQFKACWPYSSLPTTLHFRELLPTDQRSKVMSKLLTILSKERRTRKHVQSYGCVRTELAIHVNRMLYTFVNRLCACSSPTLSLQKGKFWAPCPQSNTSLTFTGGIDTSVSYRQIQQKTHPQGPLLVFLGVGVLLNRTLQQQQQQLYGLSGNSSCSVTLSSICEKLSSLTGLKLGSCYYHRPRFHTIYAH